MNDLSENYEFEALPTISAEEFALQHDIFPEIANHPKFKSAPQLAANLHKKFIETPIARIPAMTIEILSEFNHQKIQWLHRAISSQPNDQFEKTIFLLYELKNFDPETFYHSIRVAKSTCEFAKQLELTDQEFTEYTIQNPKHASRKNFYYNEEKSVYKFTTEQVQRLTIGALLHDIGKIGMDIEIVNPEKKRLQSAAKIEKVIKELERSINQIIKTDPDSPQITEIAERLTTTDEYHLSESTNTQLNIEIPADAPEALIRAISIIRHKLAPFITKQLKENQKSTISDINKLIGKILQLPMNEAAKTSIRETTGSFRERERKEMNTHSAISKIITDTFGFTEETGRLSLLHHQQGKETPYPCDIPANATNICEGLLNFVDIKVALQENRPYRAGFSLQNTTKLILEKEHLFDPLIIKNYKRILYEEQKSIRDSYSKLPIIPPPPNRTHHTPPPQSQVPTLSGSFDALPSFEALSADTLPTLHPTLDLDTQDFVFSHDEPDKALGWKK